MTEMMYKNYRSAELRERVLNMGYRPLDVLIIGSTGSGKSTSINTLFRDAVATVGMGVDPQTMDIRSYQLNDYLRCWDSPGLGDSVCKDRQHKEKIVDKLFDTFTNNGDTYALIDVVLLVIEGCRRDLGTVTDLLKDIVIPNVPADRIFVVINQADLAMKGHYWNDLRNKPEPRLELYLDDLSESVQRRIHDSCGIWVRKPVCYSAEQNYNVTGVLDLLIDNIPMKMRDIAS